MCGISLQESKSVLIESRLRRRLVALGLGSFEEYRELIAAQGAASEEWQFIINGLTTHTTEWFREIDHFKQLRNEIIPEWLARKVSRPLRIWSVACSTGEEPYSIALVLNYFQTRFGLSYEITATDIDTSVIQKAKNGVYAAKELYRIPEEYHANALAQGTGKSSAFIKVRQHIKDRIHFDQLNLSEVPYKVGNSFDLIFCRNVFIYFPPEVIAKVAKGLFQVGTPGALLFTGHSESFSNISVPWTFIKPSVYRKQEKP